MPKQCRDLDLKIWTSKNQRAAASCSSRENMLAYLQSINKQKYTWRAFGIPNMPVLNLLDSTEPQFFWGRTVDSVHTPNVVGSRHLCFKSEHSYYGFHEVCKVLCMF